MAIDFEASKIAVLPFECYESDNKINISIKAIIDSIGCFLPSPFVIKLYEWKIGKTLKRTKEPNI